MKSEEDILPLYKSIPPFTKVENGFGYLGIVMWDSKNDTIQCSICGIFLESLGKHIQHVHKIKTSEYRNKFSLLSRTPLCGVSKERERRKRAIKQYSINNPFSGHRGGKNNRKIGTLTYQEMNRKGTCPEQINATVDSLKKSGKTITKRMIPSGILKAIYIRHGSWNNYLKYRDMTLNKTSFRHEDVKMALIQFIKKYGHFPVRADFKEGFVPPLLSYRPVVRLFGSITKAREELL